MADLSGCRERLKWASEALHTFNVETAEWDLKHDPTQTAVEYHAEADVHTFRLISEPMDQRFAVVTSNIIHQIRNSLDNLVWQLVIANGCVPKVGLGGNSFPILVRDDPYKSFADHTANALQGVHPDHVALIEGLQPYRRPSGRDPVRQHPLGLLATLSNRDKHQILQIVAADQHPTADWACTFTGTFEERLDAGVVPFDELKAGAIVGWAIFAPPGFHPDVQMKWLMWLRVVSKDPPGAADKLGMVQIGPEIRFILANVAAIIVGFAPVETGGKAQPVDFEIKALVARYEAHYRASSDFSGEELPPWPV